MKRLEGKPFALLGINTDEDREKIKQVIKKEGVNWRSWWDVNTEGPICTKWNIRMFPTIYVLDAKGVIRYKEVRGEELDQAVDALLKEMEGGK